MMWSNKGRQDDNRANRVLLIRLAAVGVMLLVLLWMSGCNGSLTSWKEGGAKDANLPDVAGENLKKVKPPEQVKVTLYFKDESGRYLTANQTKIDKVPGIARAAMSALCRGPKDKKYQSSLPAAAGVRDLNVRNDGLCVVDLNREATKINDPKGEALAVYAIVNTLTEFPAVKKVQILVEGEKKGTLAGHIPIDEPLLRNLSFVKTNTP